MIKIIAKKSFIQIKRDWVMLILTMLCAPFFIFLYKLIFLEGMTMYPVLIHSNSELVLDVTDELIMELKGKSYPGGGRLFDIKIVDDYNTGISALTDHKAKVMVSINSLSDIEIAGDFSDPYYVISSNLIEKNLYEFINNRLKIKSSINIRQKAIGISRDKTEFENYVPGLIIFSTLIQLYLYVMLLLREKESRVFLRYRLCSITRVSYLTGHSIVFCGLSLVSLLVTVITAYSLGFQSPNCALYDILLSILVCFILNLGVIGIAFIISGLCNTLIHGLLLSTFPFMVMVFFSGSVYPFPRILIFNLIPATHAVTILHKLLTYGTALFDLKYDFFALMALSVLLLIIGIKQIKF